MSYSLSFVLISTLLAMMEPRGVDADVCAEQQAAGIVNCNVKKMNDTSLHDATKFGECVIAHVQEACKEKVGADLCGLWVITQCIPDWSKADFSSTASMEAYLPKAYKQSACLFSKLSAVCKLNSEHVRLFFCAGGGTKDELDKKLYLEYCKIGKERFAKVFQATICLSNWEPKSKCVKDAAEEVTEKYIAANRDVNQVKGIIIGTLCKEGSIECLSGMEAVKTQCGDELACSFYNDGFKVYQDVMCGSEVANDSREDDVCSGSSTLTSATIHSVLVVYLVLLAATRISAC